MIKFCSYYKRSCCVGDLKQNMMVPLICSHPVTNLELILTAAQNVWRNLTLLSSYDDVIETLLELTDIKIKYNTSRVIVVGLFWETWFYSSCHSFADTVFYSWYPFSNWMSND